LDLLSHVQSFDLFEAVVNVKLALSTHAASITAEEAKIIDIVATILAFVKCYHIELYSQIDSILCTFVENKCSSSEWRLSIIS